MGKRRTHEEYVSDVAKIHSNIEVVGEFVNINTKILHRCKIDGHEWNPYPSSILQGTGCPECARRRRARSHEEYVRLLFEVNSNIESVEAYVNSVTPILHRCKIDGCIWPVAPGDALRGHGCPKCGGVYRKNTEEYCAEVCLMRDDIDVVGDYINKRTPIAHQCKKCGCIWLARPNNILNGTRCPECCNVSRGENEIKKYLLENHISLVHQCKFDNCRDVNLLPFDFFLPEYNLCIEYDGVQHFEPVDVFGGEEGLRYTQRHDAIKNNFCATNKIDLLRIRYDQNIYNTLKEFLCKKYNLII